MKAYSWEIRQVSLLPENILKARVYAEWVIGSETSVPEPTETETQAETDTGVVSVPFVNLLSLST